MWSMKLYASKCSMYSRHKRHYKVVRTYVQVISELKNHSALFTSEETNSNILTDSLKFCGWFVYQHLTIVDGCTHLCNNAV